MPIDNNRKSTAVNSPILSWVIFPLLLIAFWSKVGDRSPQGGMGILGMGNSRAKTYIAGDMGVTFNDVAGVDEAKASPLENRWFINAWIWDESLSERLLPRQRVRQSQRKDLDRPSWGSCPGLYIATTPRR